MAKLVAHWKMNDSAVSNVVVDSKSFHDGTWQFGDTTDHSIAGKINQALNFDGINDSILIPDNTSFDTTTFSFCAWLKHSNTSIVWDRVLSKKNSFMDSNGYEITLDGTNSDILYTSGSSSTFATTPLGINWLSEDWHHLAVIYDTSRVTVYCDSTLKDTTGDIVPIVPNALSLSLGKIPTEWTTMWDGAMDDARYYEGSLTQQEISLLYNSGNGTESVFYHSDISLLTDGHEGTIEDPFSFSDLNADSSANPSGNVYLLKGVYVGAVPTLQLNVMNNDWKAWTPTEGPYRIYNSNILNIGNLGSVGRVSGGILASGSDTTFEFSSIACHLYDCYVNSASLIASVGFVPQPNFIMRGCTFTRIIDIYNEDEPNPYYAYFYDSIIKGINAPFTGVSANPNFRFFNSAVAQMYGPDFGYIVINCIDPSTEPYPPGVVIGPFPAWDATREAFYSILGNMPIPPQPGNPPYTDYETNLWGNARLSIGAVYDIAVEPTMQASTITFNTIGSSSLTVDWTRGDGSSVAAFIKASTTGSAAPVDGSGYTADATFTNGTQIEDTGWYCVYDGSGTSVAVTGLSSNTAYRTMAVEYNGNGPTSNYLTSDGTDNPANQVTAMAEPTVQASMVSFSAVGVGSLTVDWTRGDGSSVAAFMKATTTGSAAPVDGSGYTADATFMNGTQISSTGWYCIYNGVSTSVEVAGLLPGTAYRVMAVEYNGSDTTSNYLTSDGMGNPANQITATPSGHTLLNPLTVKASGLIFNPNGSQISLSALTLPAGELLLNL